MLRVLYVVNGIRGSGGLERVLLHKASHLSDNYGYAVEILVLNEAPGAPFYPMSPDVRIGYFQASGSPIQYLRSYRSGLRDAVARFRPDVISVCDDGLKGLLVPFLLPRRRPALVYERHASLELMGSRLQRFLMRRLARLYDQLVVLTSGSLREWRVPHAVAIPNPLPDFGVEEQRLVRGNRILCVGSLSHNKGYDLLIDAWAKIADRHPGWSVHVYGQGEVRPYRELAAAAGLAAEQIEFHAPVQDISTEYQEASFLVLPSRTEGFGMVLLEAMYFGTPCISFDCPSGPRDIVTHGFDGLLVAPEDTGALALAMNELIADPLRRRLLGQHARESAAGYHIERISLRWHRLFTSLAKGKGQA